MEALIDFLDRVESQLETDGHEDMAGEAAYWLDWLNTKETT